ncbi:STAS domain-containing protein [Streptomyces sp. NPDC056883]|uniref:STAS domain-containing protein n=1 Tax=Streptomyces sp. NPDC056883 TaxID=3345959 RepID=UPI0036D1080D
MTADSTPSQPAATQPGPHVLRLRGDMDMDHASELTAALLTGIETAYAEGRRDLVVDLTDSSFCDSSGLNVLLRARSAAADHGILLTLAAPSHQMLRLLDLTESATFFVLRGGRAAGAEGEGPLQDRSGTGPG